MVQIRWLELAKFDLKEIYEFIAMDSKRYAEHQVRQIKSRTQILKKHPLAGKMVREFEDPKLREIVCGHYRIIHRIVSPKLIHILLVHHGARELEKRLSE